MRCFDLQIFSHSTSGGLYLVYISPDVRLAAPSSDRMSSCSNGRVGRVYFFFLAFNVAARWSWNVSVVSDNVDARDDDEDDDDDEGSIW